MTNNISSLGIRNSVTVYMKGLQNSKRMNPTFNTCQCGSMQIYVIMANEKATILAVSSRKKCRQIQKES